MTDVAVAAAVAVTEPGAGHGSVEGSPEVQLNASIGLDGAEPAENQPAAAAEAADSTENEDCDAMGDGSSGAVLSKPIDVLDGLLVNEVEKPKFTSVPTGEVDYRSSADVKSKYRPWGKTPQVPTALLLDAATDGDRLKIVNWWYSISSAVQKVVKGRCARVYKKYTKSNQRKGERQRAARSTPIDTAVLPSCEALSKSIQFFDDNGVDTNSVPAKYTSTNASSADDVDWDSPASVDRHHPALAGYGGRQVPKCLLMDAATDSDKMLVVNWWRLLSVDEQKEWVGKLKGFYEKYKTSNQRKIVTSHRAAGLPTVIGQADEQSLLDQAANVSASAQVREKKTRSIRDKAATTSQKRDTAVRSATATLFGNVDTLNNATSDAGRPTAGFTSTMAVQITNVSDPAKAGFNDKETILRKRPLVEIRVKDESEVNTLVKVMKTAYESANCEVRITYMGDPLPKVHYHEQADGLKKKSAAENDADCAAQYGGSTVGGGFVEENLEDYM